MKNTFNDFIRQNLNCSGLATSITAKALYDFMNQDQMIIAMLEYADMGKPALAGCVELLEAYYTSLSTIDFSLDDDFNRQAIGRMIKTILEPFGYQPTSQKTFSKALGTKYFRSAKCYALLAKPRLAVVKTIVEIK